MFRVEVIREPERFRGLETPWQTLWDQAEGGVFQRFDWIEAWWRAAGSSNGSRLNIVLAWCGSELVAIAPFVVRRYRGPRVLEWAAKDCSDYCDVLVAPGWDKVELLTAIWQHVGRYCGFDVAYLSHLQEHANAQLLACLERKRAVPLRPSERRALATGMSLTTWADRRAWFQSLGKKGRNNHLRGWRILEADGPVTFRLVEGKDEIDRLLDKLCGLKQAWLLARGLASPVLENGAALIRELVWTLASTGRLRLFVLERSGDLVAGSVNILEGNRLLAFFAGYDPAFERASPGTILMIEYIQWAIERGFTEVDFLCGDEGYKDRFADRRAELASFTGARTPLGALALAADRWARAFRDYRSGAAVARIRSVARRTLGSKNAALSAGSPRSA